MTVDFGDLPTWLGAAGALGTMGVTIGALIYAKQAAATTRGMLKVESERDRQRDQAQARAQAEQVSGWYGKYENHPDADFDDYRGGFVRNASLLPVYDLKVEFHYRGQDGSATALRGAINHGTLPPTGAPVFIQAPVDMLRQVEDRDLYAVTLTFRDSTGRRWWREHDGVLAETKQNS